LFGGQATQAFDREDPQSFFKKAINATGEVQRTAVARQLSTRQASIRVMADHLPMMALLTLPSPIKARSSRWVQRPTSAGHPAVFDPDLFDILRSGAGRPNGAPGALEGPRWLFLLPALYTYAFYSLITHFIRAIPFPGPDIPHRSGERDRIEA